MRRWRTYVLTGAAVLLASATAAPDPLALERERLRVAKEQAVQAKARADDLERRAADERDAATRAQVEEAAIGARVDRAEAEVKAAEARIAIVDALLARRQASLGDQQAPVARLLAGLASLARRPSATAIVQPGTVTELVYVRAVLGSTLPVIQKETAGLRAALAQTRALRASETLAAQSLSEGRKALETEKAALAALQARHAAAALRLDRDALTQSDRAIAMGEEARDIVDRMAAFGETQARLKDLASLAGPPRSRVARGAGPIVYQLPVSGRLVTGFGEVSDNGVRASGLTFAVAPSVAATAPAGGKVVFARPFRHFGTIVIIDHGSGWTSLVTGLDRSTVSRGASVAQGQPIGTVPAIDEPRVTVELRRQGQPVDIAALIG